MWSIASIIGAAVAASLVLLTAGVTMAVKIERRRYRKFIQRHTTGIASSCRELNISSSHGLERVAELDLAPYQVALQDSSETWLAPACPYDLERGSSKIAEHQKYVPIRRQSLRKISRGPVKKKYRRNRRSRWITANRYWMSSPLSAISESSSSTRSSPDLPQLADALSTFSKSHELHETQTVKRASSNFRSAQNTISGNPSPCDSITGTVIPNQNSGAHHVTRMQRSFSTSSNTSSAPETSLQLVLGAEMHGTSRSVSLGACPPAANNNTADHPGLSVSKSPPHHCANVITSTKSQGLEEFDFGINVEKITRMRSPAQLTPKSIYDSRAVAVASFRASVNSFNEDHISVVRCHSAKPKALSPLWQTGKTPDASESRHSMFESRPNRSQQSLHLMSGAVMDDDPFVTKIPRRTKSVEVRTLIRKVEPETDLRKTPLSTLGISNQGHKRQNCIRISGLPIMQTPWKNRLLSVSNIVEESLLEDESVELADKAIKNDALGRTGQQPHVDRATASETGQRPFDVFKQSVPATPELVQESNWRFHLRPPSTPISSPSPSVSPTSSRLRFENSPILPSPAYSTSKLHIRPRQSLVRGPRSPRVANCDVSSGVTTVYNSNNDNSKARLSRKRSASNDLNSSMKMRRNTSTANMSVKNSASMVGPSTVQQKIPSIAQGLGSATPNSEIPPQPDAPQLSIQKIPVSESNISISNTSIWEDVSVKGDSASTSRSHSRAPSPLTAPTDLVHPTSSTPIKRDDFLALVRLDINTIPHNTNGIPVDHISTPLSQSSPQTPRTKKLVEDPEAYENFVKNYGVSCTEHIRSSVQMQSMTSKKGNSSNNERVSGIRGLGISPYVRNPYIKNRSSVSDMAWKAKLNAGSKANSPLKSASKIPVRVPEINTIPDTPRSMYDQDGFLKD